MAINSRASEIAALHIRYSNEIHRATTGEDPIHMLFKDRRGDIPKSKWRGDGRQFEEDILLNGMHVATGIGEQDGFPAHGPVEIKALTINLKFCTTAVGGTRQLFDYSRGNNIGEYAQYADIFMREAALDKKDYAARAIFGDGSGRICNTNGAHAIGATTINVDNPNMHITPNNGAKYLRAGRLIAFADPTDTTVLAVAKVQSVGAGGTSIVITPALAVALPDNCIIYLSTSSAGLPLGFATTNKNNDTMGLKGIVNNAAGFPSYFGQNRVLTPQLESIVFNAVGALTPAVIQRGLTAQQIRGSSSMLDPSKTVLIGDFAMRDTFAEMNSTLRRLGTAPLLRNPDVGTLAASNKSNLTFGEFEILASNNSDEGSLIFFSTNGSRKVFVELGWDDRTGSIWKQITNSIGQFTSEHVAHHHTDGEFYHVSPGECVRMNGITTTPFYVPQY